MARALVRVRLAPSLQAGQASRLRSVLSVLVVPRHEVSPMAGGPPRPPPVNVVGLAFSSGVARPQGVKRPPAMAPRETPEPPPVAPPLVPVTTHRPVASSYSTVFYDFLYKYPVVENILLESSSFCVKSASFYVTVCH